MLETFGEDALAKLLAAYADNLSTSAAIKRCFEIEQDEFEQGFKKYVTNIVSGLKLNREQEVKSFADLQEASEKDPDNFDLLAQLALGHLERGDNPKARQLAVDARKKEPKNQLAAYVLARLYLSIGDTEQALELLEKSLDEKKPQENALALLAGLKLRAEDFDAAERLYQLGEEQYPHADKWLKALAQVYVVTKDAKKLEPVLTKLAGLDADSLAIRKKLADLAMARDDFNSALSWAKQALHIDVMDAEVHATLGKAMARLKQKPEAAEHLEDAIRLNPKQVEWRLDLAKVYVESKKDDKARKTLSELLEIDPDHKEAAALLGSLKSDE
jgi:FimV-like protein